jgi:protein-disulfide isomerase
MIRSMLGAAFAICLSTQAFAADLAELSDDDRAAFRDEVRAYLLENPEVIMEAIQVLKDRDAAAEAQNDVALVQDNKAALFNSATDWVGGNKDGDITIIEFMDYRCSYCKKANAEIAELVKSDGNIRFILKEYPILGDESDLASRYAIAVRQIGGDSAYAAAHDALMVMRADITPAALDRISTDLGLDPSAINARMQTADVTDVIAANRALGGIMQINGTPTFIVQKTLLRGYVPLDGMREIVAGERKG